MILALRLVFVGILLAMLSVTSWASFQCPLFGVPRAVATHPWFIATLFDAYFGFLTFFLWVAYKERAWASKVAWFVAIMLLGNIAMAVFCLQALFVKSASLSITDILTLKRDGVNWLGVGLAALGGAVLFLA